ncbi:LysR substrate-binding domain-containing protein [Candidatus Burkholderia verschuerenii]|uniref:LysR substrate-binding domain-containing protein n=1 Tax=Candidatus Burkholderia verschuerenii TaxID=242163 RepID=UPI0018DC3020
MRYFRVGETTEGWERLGRDFSHPVFAPSLLASRIDGCEIRIQDLPILQCAVGNWDWELWCETFGVSLSNLTFAHEFDTDDAALHACVAGLGVMLAPPILTAREIRSGALVTLSTYESVEMGEYCYRRHSDSMVAQNFCFWMETEMRGGK